jgi:hypothetical protein
MMPNAHLSDRAIWSSQYPARRYDQVDWKQPFFPSQWRFGAIFADAQAIVLLLSQ